MKYAYPEIEGYFDLTTPKIHTLIIENPRFFRELLADFHTQLAGEKGRGVLSVSDSPVEMASHLEVLDSFVPFDLNKRSLLTKLTASLEREAVSPEHYEKTMCLLRDLEVYLDELAFDLPCDVVFSKLTIGAVLKGVSPEIHVEGDLCEKVLDYFELVRNLEREKLFVTVNFRSYITDEEFLLFSEAILSHDYRLFMLESAAKEKIPLEERVIIDPDLCEIY